MSDRIKILACGSVERLPKHILESVQLQVINIKTRKRYNIECRLLGDVEDTDGYELTVCNVSDPNCVIDSCRFDSSGGVYMDEDFSCTELDFQTASAILELVLTHFIVEF